MTSHQRKDRSYSAKRLIRLLNLFSSFLLVASLVEYGCSAVDDEMRMRLLASVNPKVESPNPMHLTAHALI